jgi:hypothetical protein
MPLPPDHDRVQYAFRLGWALAELRGRYRPENHSPISAPSGARTDHALPLGEERSEAEQLIEIHHVLADLAQAVAVDDQAPDGAATFSQALDELGRRLRSGDTSTWPQITDLIYEWDASIQDRLAITSTQAAAYQLGRGMAEVYWALDPAVADPTAWCGWQFLLGDRRCATLTRLVSRLADYLDPLTPPAIRASVTAWHAVAADPRRRSQPDAVARLHQQGLLWRDLVRGERRPADLATAHGIRGRIGILIPVIRALHAQIAIGLAAIAALVVGATQVSVGHTDKTNIATALIGAIGLTSASLYARAKATANSLLDQIKTRYAHDRVSQAATIVPPRTTPHTPRQAFRATARQLGAGH